MPLEPTQIIVVILIAFAAAVVQGSAGLGYSLLAAPFFTLIDPDLVPVPLLVSSMVLSLLIGYREREAVVIGELGWAFAGYLPGALAATLLLTTISSSGLPLFLAGLVLVAVLLSLFSPQIPVTRATLLVIGVAAGFMGTSAAISGPPIALLYQNRDGARIRATLAFFFLGGALLSVTMLALGGHYSREAFVYSLLLLPVAGAGFALSGPFLRLLGPRSLRPAILAISAAAALLLIWRTLS